MKRLFYKATGAALASVLFFYSAVAQTANLSVNNDQEMQKEAWFAAAESKSDRFGALSKTNVNAKVLRSFMKLYKEAPEPMWYGLKNDYIAEFEKDGRKTRTVFAKSGYVFYTIIFGTEKDLPADAKKLIKSNFVDYAIGRTLKVNTMGQEVWIANLQHADNLIIVRVADRSLDVLEDNKTLPVFNKEKKRKPQ